MAKKEDKIKEIAHYYILAFILLMGYYLAEFMGITGWAFEQKLYIMLPVLTAYYGTVIWIADSILHKVLELK